MNVFKVIAETYRRVKALSAVDSRGGGGWINIISEAWSGAWQQNVVVDSPKNILAFSAVYACVTTIASDVAKLCVDLVREDEDGICEKVKSSPFLKVLRKPNFYQTRLKFIEQWIVQKLLNGNAYILKARDNRNMVSELYVLDANRVKALVAENGDVYYELARDDLSSVREPITVPASEIIHDRMVCLWHPLVGVSPIYACGISATMGNKIQAGSTDFFKNMARPGGVLSAPGIIPPDELARLQAKMDEGFSGKNIGRTLVTGGGLIYSAMPGIPPQDAQLIEQLKWTVEDVARAFHVPLFKIGGPIPVGSTVETLQQMYYSDCLQALIESLESALDEGLELKTGYYTQVDLDGLLRMDYGAQIKAEGEAVQRGLKSPDEGRRRFNLKAVPGGQYPYLQQQNYSLQALAKRDAKEDPFATKSAESAKPASEEPNAAQLMLEFMREMKTIVVPAPLALPAPVVEDDEDLREIAHLFVAGMATEVVTA